MRLLPEVIAELDPNIRWAIATRLRIIKEIACGPLFSVTGAPTMEEGWNRMGRAVVLRDWKAEDAAITDYMRAEVRAWWQDFPEQGLLTDLYQRAARRRAKSGSLDNRRRPSHEEGLRVARALLADIHVIGPLDVLWEAAAITKALADLYFPPLAYAPATWSEGTSNTPGLGKSFSTPSTSSVRSWKTEVRPSVDSFSRGDKRLPMDASGVPE